MNEDRRQPRIPIRLKVSYRTAGAFLVSYSVNLSKGGIFIETEEPLAIGETVVLSFEVPGAGELTVESTVTWVRPETEIDALGDGLPRGMGVQFQTLEEHYGSVLDGLVRGFLGLTVLIVTPSPERLTLLGRYVRSIVTCEIFEATDAGVASVALESGPDLVLVDLDARPEIGMRTIAEARGRAAHREHSTPVILLAADVQLRKLGLDAGADEALATPPSYRDLQAAVIRTLAKPAAIRGAK